MRITSRSFVVILLLIFSIAACSDDSASSNGPTNIEPGGDAVDESESSNLAESTALGEENDDEEGEWQSEAVDLDGATEKAELEEGNRRSRRRK